MVDSRGVWWFSPVRARLGAGVESAVESSQMMYDVELLAVGVWLNQVEFLALSS